MAVLFPSIEPTARSFAAPKWPTTVVTSQSGVRTRRLWGSRPSQAELSLTFRHINDEKASQLLASYNAAKGSTIDLTLPDIIFRGASDTLKTWLDASATGAGMKWYFSEQPPTVESISPGVSTVQLSLIGELRLT